MKIKGIAKTRQVFLDGKELLPDKALGYIRFDTKKFEWGDHGSGSSLLAAAILLDRFSTPIDAIEKSIEFRTQYLAPLPKDKDFEFEVNFWKTQSFN